MARFKKQTLIIIAAVFGAGVVCAYNFEKGFLAALIALGVLAAASGVMAFLAKKDRKYAFIAAVLYFCCVFAGGYAYTSAKMSKRPEPVSLYDIQFSGTITGRPYRDNDGARFVCELTDICVNDEQVDKRFRFYLRGEPEELVQIGCGERVSGMGHLFIPETPTNSHDFDFGLYLYRQGLYGYITAYTSNVTFDGERGGAYDLIYRAKSFLVDRVNDGFGENADIVNALLLGERRDMSDELKSQFADAGVAHLLAISGLHLSLIAAAVALLFRPLFGKRISGLVAAVIIMLYGVLIGYSASVTRAVMMYALLAVISFGGLPTNTLTRLSCAFVVMLLINPLNIGDAGFVLSFTATAGIVILVPEVSKLAQANRIPFDKWYHKLARRVVETVIVTLCAEIATLPAVAFYYSSVPILSIFSNLLLVPYTAVCMAVSVIGIIVPQAAFIPSFMFGLLKRAVALVSGVSWSSVIVSAPPFWVWLAVMIIILAVSEVSPLKDRYKKYALALLPLCAAAVLIMPGVPALRMVFLDVGQAKCAVLRSTGVNCIIDTGLDGQEAISYAEGENIEIDSVFITHPHIDHAGGILELAEELNVRKFYVPVEWFDMAEVPEIIDECEQAKALGAEFVLMKPGDTVQMGSSLITACEQDRTSGDALNDISLMLKVEYNGFTALFTGDGKIGDAPDVDVLEVSHHGSIDTNNEEMIKKMTPEIAIISAGLNNQYGLPDMAVVKMLEECGADIYRTDFDGEITVDVNAKGEASADTFK